MQYFVKTKQNKMTLSEGAKSFSLAVLAKT